MVYNMTERQARRELEIRTGQALEGRAPTAGARRLRIKDLAADLEAEYKAKGRRSVETLKYRLAHLKRFFGQRHGLSITTADVHKYIADRVEDGASTSTVRAELTKLKRMFNLAFESERLSRKPYIPMPRDANPRTGFFQHEQFRAVLAQLPDYLKPVLEFGYYTGWRRDEVTSLTWDQVDLSARTVRLWAGTTKSGEGRVMPLEGELWRIIEAQRAARRDGCSWVFHGKGRRIRTFYKTWRDACKNAGCPGMLFHDLRRTAARNFRRAGLSQDEAMALRGWKTDSVFRRYDIVSESDLRDAAWRAQAFLAGNGAETGKSAQPENSTYPANHGQLCKNSVG
jgi:integrase